MLALFPPNATFFRLTVRSDIANYLEATQELKQKIEQALVQREQVMLNIIEAHQMRVTMLEAIKQLLIAGNVLLFLPPKEGGIKLYRLQSYVVQRDPIGNIIHIVATDKMTVATLPVELRGLVGNDKKPEDELVVYTHVYFDNEDDCFYSYQELDSKRIPDTDQKYPKSATPWLAPRLIKVDGESYSRGYVEEYIGDLKTYEKLSKALGDYAAIASTVINLVNPNGITQVRKIVKTKNGGFAPGRREDISTLQLDKAMDLQVARATAEDIKAQLSFVFMLNSAVQRDGERVTAEEIRYAARELEDTLGGIYSILSQELQLPLVRRLLNQLEANGILSPLPDGLVEPSIITGMEAIGRGHDYAKLTEFLQTIQLLPDAAMWLNTGQITQALASSRGIDTTGIIKTPEELAEEQNQQMMANTAQNVAPNLVNGVMNGLNKQGGN